jgi:hypothetical protein
MALCQRPTTRKATVATYNPKYMRHGGKTFAPRQKKGRIRWFSHLEFDARHVAKIVGEKAQKKIEENLDKGKGAKGSFGYLMDSTIDNYERSAAASAWDGSMRSRMQKSGYIRDNIERITRYVGKVGALVTFSVRGNPVYAYVQNAVRSWMGLSRRDFRAVLQASIDESNRGRSTALVSKPGPPKKS